MIEKVRLIKFKHIICICPTQSVVHVAFVVILTCMSLHADIVGSYVILGVVSEDNVQTLVWPVMLFSVYCSVLKGFISCKSESFRLHQVWALCKLAITVLILNFLQFVM